MPYVVAATVLVGIIGVANLVLTYGVIRRLREHSALLTIGPPRNDDFEQAKLPVGGSVADFEAITTDGLDLSRDGLTGETLVGFFARSCDSCAEELPRFVELAAGIRGGRDQVLAVVMEDGLDAGEMIGDLAGVARVVRAENPENAIVRAFQARAFPAFFFLDDGVVRAAEFRVGALPAWQPS
ncbi:TlpA disulfide reductase family protein [Sphaerisporangium corydalis]|uniref:TlpA disulfide reductase family protein n=1 Tax=Sphaerisporangium corydalis TaxID=1441875 RepID=A0ABV9EJ12_9ACTN|nr:TlpA disulfide reductase family protein [Sphaerisporangium corydalis]